MKTADQPQKYKEKRCVRQKIIAWKMSFCFLAQNYD